MSPIYDPAFNQVPAVSIGPPLPPGPGAPVPIGRSSGMSYPPPAGVVGHSFMVNINSGDPFAPTPHGQPNTRALSFGGSEASLSEVARRLRRIANTIESLEDQP